MGQDKNAIGQNTDKGLVFHNVFAVEDIQEIQDRLADALEIALQIVDKDKKPVTAVSNSAEPALSTRKNARELMVNGHVVAYLLADMENLSKEKEILTGNLLTTLSEKFSRLVSKPEAGFHPDFAEKQDSLTGFMGRRYFENRMRVIDRAEILPVSLIAGNINDSLYINNRYGREEEDRLIRTVADIIREEAGDYYIVGRWGGDELNIVIPRGDEEEARDFCGRVQKRCEEFEDPVLAPTIAFGVVVKNNIEQTLTELLSDAEYAMFENKYAIKNAAGYRERLEKNG